jgi:two-component system, OmpR family, phosphate regulon response regulator OmpR
MCLRVFYLRQSERRNITLVSEQRSQNQPGEGGDEAENEAQTPHVLVIDDDRRIRTLLQKFLVENGFRVTAAGNAPEARAFLRGLEFDILVLDIMMPGEDGLELTRSLRQISDVPILLLTARTETEDRIEGLEAGADDYLQKPFEPRELVLRLGSILKRAHQPLPDVKTEIKMGNCRYTLDRGELWRGEKLVKLTAAEGTLLRFFAENPREKFSRLDLCDRTGVGQERSIDVQITRLRRKIEADPKMPIYLQTVRGVGYTLVPD